MERVAPPSSMVQGPGWLDEGWRTLVQRRYRRPPCHVTQPTLLEDAIPLRHGRGADPTCSNMSRLPPRRPAPAREQRKRHTSVRPIHGRRRPSRASHTPSSVLRNGRCHCAPTGRCHPRQTYTGGRSHSGRACELDRMQQRLARPHPHLPTVHGSPQALAACMQLHHPHCPLPTACQDGSRI